MRKKKKESKPRYRYCRLTERFNLVLEDGTTSCGLCYYNKIKLEKTRG